MQKEKNGKRKKYMANEIKLAGTIVTEAKFSHKSYGRKFYEFYISVERLSKKFDVLPCFIQENLLNEIHLNEKIVLYGEIRTWNEHKENKNHLVIHVYVQSVSEYKGDDENFVELQGFICKMPIYRKTPRGRYLTELLMASNRVTSWKSDYIPCIVWNENALKTSYMEIGDKITITGRLQSREYKKKLSQAEFELHEAYELSVSQIL